LLENKVVPQEKKLNLENLELRKSNMELQAQVLQTRLVNVENEYQKNSQELDRVVNELNEELGIDIRKYKVGEDGTILDQQGKPVDFSKEDQPKETKKKKTK